MKAKRLRTIIPLVIGAVVFFCFLAGVSAGTLSAFGWGDLSVICPLGALATMLASKAMLPRALVSLALAVVGIILLGRAFCGWICPVPLTTKLPRLFRKSDKQRLATGEGSIEKMREERKVEQAPENRPMCPDCGSKVDSRHIVLAGSLLSAAVFGFPVFCLICPIGLSFATLFLLALLFGQGDVTLAVLVAPILLVLEVVVFRKWCGRICPLGAFMSLIGKANKTFVPTADLSKCLEADGSSTCGRCASVCEVGIDVRNGGTGVPLNECTKCRACVESCPGKAITMPFLPKRGPLEQAKGEIEAASRPGE